MVAQRLGRACDDALPIPSDLVYAQYPRLGATAAWLARSFYNGLLPHQIPAAILELRNRLAWWSQQPPSALEAQRASLAAALRTLQP